MFINKDICSIIESYTQYHNLYNFINNNSNLDVVCDRCHKTFYHCLNRNKIKYKINDFNNNLIHYLKTACLDLNELQIFTNITYLNIEYIECNYIFCNMCILNIESIEKNHKLNTFGLTDFEYISEKYTNLIKFNNNYFHNDLIESYNITIDRRKYNLKEEKLFMELIRINNYNYNQLQKLNPANLIKFTIFLIQNFNINLDHINAYIKIKYQ